MCMSSFIQKKIQKKAVIKLNNCYFNIQCMQAELSPGTEKPATTSMKRECVVQEKAFATSCIWSPFLENCGDTTTRNIDGGQGLCVGTRVPTKGGGETRKDVGNSKPYHFYSMSARKYSWLNKLVHNGNFLNSKNKINKDGFLNKFFSGIVKKK